MSHHEGMPLYGTDEEKEYRFRPMHGKALRFKCKAANDCGLCFSAVEGETDDMFEVFIGAWKGKSSAIRFRQSDDLVKVDTHHIISEDEYREFWVTFDDGIVRVGHEDDWEPFMEAELPESIDVKYFGYSTGWGSTGWWQFLNERSLETEDGAPCHYEPVYGTSLSFSLSCSNDAYIFLTKSKSTSTCFQIIIGGWHNQTSAIRLDKDKGQTVVKVDTPDILSEDEEKLFYITFKDGRITVGEHGQDPFMVYNHHDHWKVKYFGYSTSYGSSGRWKLGV